MSAAAVSDGARATTTRRLLVLELDDDGRRHRYLDPGRIADLELVRAAGHQVAIRTGLPLVGLLPLARRLGLSDDGVFAVCSGGATTVRLTVATAAGYEVVAVAPFDPGPLVRQVQALAAGALVAVEQLGDRWRVNHKWPTDLGLIGAQHQVTNNVLTDGARTPQVIVHAPSLAQDTDALESLTRLTVTPVGQTGTYRVTASPAESDQAIESVQARLGLTPDAATAASLDSLAATAESLVPSAARQPGMSPLAAQLVAASATATLDQVEVRVWHTDDKTSPDLKIAETWTREADGGDWIRHAPIPAARGVTMRDIEVAAEDAGLDFPRGDLGRRRAHWRSTAALGHHSLDLDPGFALRLGPDMTPTTP